MLYKLEIVIFLQGVCVCACISMYVSVCVFVWGCVCRFHLLSEKTIKVREKNTNFLKKNWKINTVSKLII